VSRLYPRLVGQVVLVKSVPGLSGAANVTMTTLGKKSSKVKKACRQMGQ